MGKHSQKFTRKESSKRKNLSGLIFGSWTVIGEAKSICVKGGQQKLNWYCRCDCGKEVYVYQNSLTSGKSKSCGCKLSTRKPFGISALKSLYTTYRTKCVRQNKDFNLSEDQFAALTQQCCFYCNKPPSNVFGSKRNNGKYIYNGIDRVNNKEGYTLANCVPCCKNCNMGKRSLTQLEFFEMVKMIYERHNLNEK